MALRAPFGVELGHLSSHLRAAGWQLRDRTASYTLWTDGEREVLVPQLVENDDFPRLLETALTQIARFERRGIDTLISDLRETAGDVVRVRALFSASDRDRLPLSVGRYLFSASHDLLLAAACAAIEPRPNYPHRKFAEANDFVRRAQLEQTERGSFTVRVTCPIASGPAAADALSAHSEEPFSRRVVAQLTSALDVAWKASRDLIDGTEFDVTETVRAGVSANLCSALGSLHDDEDTVIAIETSVAWARSRPAPGPWRRTFSKESLNALKAVAQLLTDNAPLENITCEGLVQRLQRDVEGAPGIVTVYGFLDGKNKPRKIKLELSGADYDGAIKAHREGLMVMCVGTATMRGRHTWLENVRDFSVFEDDSES